MHVANFTLELVKPLCFTQNCYHDRCPFLVTLTLIAPLKKIAEDKQPEVELNRSVQPLLKSY